MKAVPCPSLGIIHYHAPSDAMKIGQWISGKLPDPDNMFDTPETVSSVRLQNAAISSICGAK